MPNLEWEVAHELVTPAITIELNQVVPTSTGDGAGRVFQIQPDYHIVPTLRLTQDNISQADGSVIHPRYKSGMVMSLVVMYRTSEDGTYPGAVRPALGRELREMHEEMMYALDSIRDAPKQADVQRIIWTPTGYGDRRMLDKIALNAWPEQSRDESSNSVSFSLETQFPYAIDLTEADVVCAPGAHTITNVGNTPFFPVIEVTATAAFTITNADAIDDDGNPLKISYSAGLPGAVNVPGGGAEIDTFKGTIFVGGSGADLIAGIDPTISDFFPLVPGPNHLTITGTTATFKTNNSWT